MSSICLSACLSIVVVVRFRLLIFSRVRLLPFSEKREDIFFLSFFSSFLFFLNVKSEGEARRGEDWRGISSDLSLSFLMGEESRNPT